MVYGATPPFVAAIDKRSICDFHDIHDGGQQSNSNRVLRN